MKSYHLVRQALDFVPVISGGGIDYYAYSNQDIKKATAYAKTLGFKLGGDWTSLIDKPHLQFNYKGYGTDIFGKWTEQQQPKPVEADSADGKLTQGERGPNVQKLNQMIHILTYTTKTDDLFDQFTLATLKAFQKDYGLPQDGIYTSVVGAVMTKAIAEKQSNEKAQAQVKRAVNSSHYKSYW